MAIVNMMRNYVYDFNLQNSVECAEFPEGAYCPVFGYDYNHFTDADSMETRKERALVLYTTHHGLCLYEREANGYNDSDFYMTVWNPEKKCPEEIQFATTRGWTYPCYGSWVDATPEVQAEYDVFLKNVERRHRILARWKLRNLHRANSAKAGLTCKEYGRLTATYSSVPFEACLKLLSSNLRSDFKKSLAKQLRDWLADPAPKYNTPFSHKQLKYII